MSCNSSHLCTKSINFSSVSEDKQAALIASKRSKLSGGDVITVHIIRIEQVQTGPDPFRHVKYSRSAMATERNWDVTEMFLSVWTSPFKLHMRKFYWTVTFRDGTETWRIVWNSPKPPLIHSVVLLTTIWYMASTMLYISSRVMKPSLSTSYSRNAPETQDDANYWVVAVLNYISRH
jgi:hypothetical protein